MNGEALREIGLENEPILFRMTGCPNGYGRPYNADFGFVGRAPNRAHRKARGAKGRGGRVTLPALSSRRRLRRSSAGP